MTTLVKPYFVDWAPRFLFGGPRPLSNVKQIFIHTTENDASTPAENVANYQINSQSGSYHYLVDRTKLLRENTDDWRAWHTGNRGNDIGLGISFVGRAAWTRAQWLNEEKTYGTITRAAYQVAQWSKIHNIPLVELTTAQVRAEQKGISTHNGARLAWGGTTHWDPGSGFPMDVLISQAKKWLNNTPNQAPQKEDTDMTPDQSAKLDRIHHEITHQFDSRVDLDKLKAGEIKKEHVFKETLIGYVLELDRKAELDRQKNEWRDKALQAVLDSLKITI